MQSGGMCMPDIRLFLILGLDLRLLSFLDLNGQPLSLNTTAGTETSITFNLVLGEHSLDMNTSQ
jgi:hypothetical protein